MLFSILIGVVSTLIFFGQRLFMKLKFIVRGGKAAKISNAKIPYVIFSDHKRYWNVFKPVCDEFEKRKIDIAYWTASSDDPALCEKYGHVKTEFIGEGNKAFARLNMMNAGICLSTTPGLDVLQWKRSRTCDFYVHIPHSLDEMLGYRMFGVDFYDAVLLTGDFQGEYIRRLEKMRNLPQKELLTVGYPPMDEQKKRLDAVSKIPNQVKNDVTVLVAPSWGENAILKKFGVSFLSAIQKTGFNIIVRPHPQTVSSEKDMLANLMSQFPEIEAYILKELEYKSSKSRIAIEFIADDVSLYDIEIMRTAFKNHFKRRAEEQLIRNRKSLRRWLSFLFFGVALLSLFLFLAHFFRVHSDGKPIFSILSESFAIIGWVALWEPATYFLYGRSAERRLLYKFMRLHHATVTITAATGSF